MAYLTVHATTDDAPRDAPVRVGLDSQPTRGPVDLLRPRMLCACSGGCDLEKVRELVVSITEWQMKPEK